jgi:hypothetical protein
MRARGAVEPNVSRRAEFHTSERRWRLGLGSSRRVGADVAFVAYVEQSRKRQISEGKKHPADAPKNRPHPPNRAETEVLTPLQHEAVLEW